MADPRKVGFVGLGNMGWPMAANIAGGGLELVVHDANAETSARFAAEYGNAVAASGPESFGDVEVLVTMLPDDRIVASALIDGGIAAALPRGAVIVDMSSSRPLGTRELATRLPDGIALVDAPVSGGVPRATDGSLTLMVGGEEEPIARVQPILRLMGARIYRTGELGSGHAVKALNNYLAAAAYAAGAEALEIGREFGLDPATIVQIVNTSTGRSFVSEIVLTEHVVTGTYATGFALALLAKDAGIAADLATELGVDAPTAQLVSSRWKDAVGALPAGSDHSEAHKAWWPATAAANSTPVAT
ncbi:NAD(P)-dependent oxidoreductase [Conexibacter sp. CPCC 206217]|uniref:NAD(P)-dependent oxidoreductase n=1 Tax=Conexibacter sp. CPCC 206217 TaxID=3064574 RepID=UPI0027281A01|nr:NAD(P)-dependent oxidoreductase [Conexibacter sp. CPCC 206217]MDO8211162.1 NAD(P)-dependent oxidoreductase [Conexibacter sp. CPCC 206217]